jgi:hypothetical protein
MSPAGLGTENDYAGEGQQQLLTTGSSSSQKECYIRAITESVELKKMLVVDL